MARLESHAVFRWSIIAAVLVCVLGLAEIRPSCADDADPEPATVHTGRRLEQELTRPLNVVLNRTSPRIVVERLQELHQVAILLDRRIDPDQQIDVQLVQSTLEEGLRTLANQLDGELAQVGGTLYIGPADRVDLLRTLIALRVSEVREIDGNNAIQRQFDLLRGTTFRWPMLAEPAELLTQVAASFRVKPVHVGPTDTSTLPHDLWGAGVLADVNAPQALSLVLGQFDLTFEWQENGNAFQIVTMPAQARVEQSHVPRGMTTNQALERIRQEWPTLEPRTEGRTIIVLATAGQHDAIDEVIAPKASDTTQPKLPPLSAQRFTLTARRVQAIAVIRTLESQGVSVEYESDALKAAGIDLQQRITLQLDEAKAEELFDQLCTPLGLAYAITSNDDRRVRLSPK